MYGTTLRRHLHGHARHELLSAIPRHHRGQHRDRHGRAVVRRERLPPGLRQEHARVHHRDGASQSPGSHGLRRNDQARVLLERRAAGHRLRVPIIRAVRHRRDRRGGARGHRAELVPGRGRVRRHVRLVFFSPFFSSPPTAGFPRVHTTFRHSSRRLPFLSFPFDALCVSPARRATDR